MARDEMDDVHRAYLDKMVNDHIIPNLPDVDLSQIDRFLCDEKNRFLAHRSRFLETYARLMRHARPQKQWRIAETGSLSGVSAYLQHEGYDVRALFGDFRYRIECPDNDVDMLISCEVAEHIKDQDSKTFDDLVNFNFSGIQQFISEMWRIVRPGGLVVLTTPNACALINLTRLLEGIPPMMLWPHVKEYSQQELIRRFESRGFKVLHSETLYALFYLDVPHRNSLLERHFTERGYSPDNRGDVAFYVFKKPLDE